MNDFLWDKYPTSIGVDGNVDELARQSNREIFREYSFLFDQEINGPKQPLSHIG